MARRFVSSETPALQQAAIIEAALRVLDSEGLVNVTLRRVASELNVQAPALYWHIKDKTTLIDYMAEAILQTQFKDLAPRTENESWQTWLIATMNKLRTAMLTYKDGGRVVTGAHLFPAVTLLNLFEISLESLISAGLDLPKAHSIVATTIHFVFGRVIEEQSGPSPEQLQHVRLDELFAAYPLFLRAQEQDDRLSYSEEFENSLRLIINGASKEGNQE